MRDAAITVTFGPGSKHAGTICYALDAKVLGAANANPNVAAVITTPELTGRVDASKGCIASARPQRTFYDLHNRLFDMGRLHPHEESSIDPTAQVAPSAILGRNVSLGTDVVVDHGAIVDDFTVVGDGTYIGPNAVIGARGVYNTHMDGENVMVRCAGAVRIGKRCEILAGAVIAKPYLAELTEIADDVKIGARAIVGHGCRIGSSTIVGAGSVIAGNASVGRQVWIGPTVSVAEGRNIGDQARVLIGSVAIRDVPTGETVSGNFAFPHAAHLLQFIRRLVAK